MLIILNATTNKSPELDETSTPEESKGDPRLTCNLRINRNQMSTFCTQKPTTEPVEPVTNHHHRQSSSLHLSFGEYKNVVRIAIDMKTIDVNFLKAPRPVHWYRSRTDVTIEIPPM